MNPEEFYPPKCPICYYANTCNHKGDPSPTQGCYTHKRDCLIWAGNNPTTGKEGHCTCGYKIFDFNKYFYYYEKLQWSEKHANQPSLTVFCRETPETTVSKTTVVFAEKEEK